MVTIVSGTICYRDLPKTEPKNSFPVTYPETDDDSQISLWKDKICGEHLKWVYFFSCIEEESGVFDTLMHTHLKLTVNCLSSVILIDLEVFGK